MYLNLKFVVVVYLLQLCACHLVRMKVYVLLQECVHAKVDGLAVIVQYVCTCNMCTPYYTLEVNNMLNFNLSITAVCSPSCQNGGSCIQTGVCSCPNGWTGSICETGVDKSG